MRTAPLGSFPPPHDIFSPQESPQLKMPTILAVQQLETKLKPHHPPVQNIQLCKMRKTSPATIAKSYLTESPINGAALSTSTTDRSTIHLHHYRHPPPPPSRAGRGTQTSISSKQASKRLSSQGKQGIRSSAPSGIRTSALPGLEYCSFDSRSGPTTSLQAY